MLDVAHGTENALWELVFLLPFYQQKEVANNALAGALDDLEDGTLTQAIYVLAPP
jgi:hypothetical protein